VADYLRGSAAPLPGFFVFFRHKYCSARYGLLLSMPPTGSASLPAVTPVNANRLSLSGHGS